MRISILTIFPEMFAPLSLSILGRAQLAGRLKLDIVNIRDYSADKHRKCDDTPYGGGMGMVMTPEPIYEAVQAVDPDRVARRIYLSPKGRTYSQKEVVRLAEYAHIVLLCGHYEGVDQRVIDLCFDEELSIGDYVLTGGEIAAMVVADSAARYVEGVLSDGSTHEESFADGLLEYPQYTRPRDFMGRSVPEELLTGNHAEIAAYRHREALRVTRKNRPDLYRKYVRRKERA